MVTARRLPILLALLAYAGCHLALGLEDAETIPAPTGPPCTTVDECDDNKACTTDQCVDGSCVYERLNGVDAPGLMQIAGDCRRIRCQDGNDLDLPDDSDVPDDGKECTNDACDNGMVINEEIPLHTPCPDTAGFYCNDSGDCVECTRNEHCQGVDECGGGGTLWECGCSPSISCQSPPPVLTCGTKPDDGCGETLDCDNDDMDGNETDVDCGGTPPTTCQTRCQTGQGCIVNADCASGMCDPGMMQCL
jgi:hypothetical protein